MEHDQLYLNVFHQPFYNLQMYKEYILTTIRFPLVYDNEQTPSMISLYSLHLESKITLPSTFISNLISSMEYTLRKLIYLSSREPMTFHPGTLSSRYHIESKKRFIVQATALIELIYIDKSQDPEKSFTLHIIMPHMTIFYIPTPWLQC